MSFIRSVPELLIHHAEARGQQTAFSGSGRAVTYTDLATRTARVAGHLAAAGIAHGDRVAIVLGSRVENVESTLAITRAGAVGVPLDPRSSHAELVDALAKSGARGVITDGQRLPRVQASAEPGTVIVVVALEAPEGVLRYEDLAGGDASRPAPDDLDLDEPAWLLYTSGTTGERKGVLSSQRAWLWSATYSCAPALNMTSEDRLFWPLPLFHALGHSLCVLGTLAVGASAHIPGDEPLLDSLLSRPVTMVAGVPTTYRELLAASRTDPRPLPQPRACVTGGAPAPAGLSAEVEAAFGVPLLNRYGCTEFSGGIAANRPGDSYSEDSCGAPLPGVQVRLVHLGRMNDTADGEEGEIWVRSPSLMLRYDKDSQPPFTDGWYRTGDLGRWADSGRLAVTGRLKELIIRGGENIHPAEVERGLRGCPGVADAIVTGVSHDMLGEVPAAFIVPTPDGVDLIALLASCRSVLPDYKVPAMFYQIDQVPRTASGKPRRTALNPSMGRPLTARLLAKDSIQPLVLTETAAACDVAPGVHVDPDQPFMNWGLTSLAGLMLRDRLATLTGLELPATLVFDYPTPTAVGEYLQVRLFGAPQPTAAPVAQPQVPLESTDPIAIISMACRYPGGISSPEDLWRVVSEGVDVSSDFPDDRGWDLENLYDPDPDKVGATMTKRGGFIRNVAEFDAGLFGISPREALATDPQQRLLLETAWELTERAGIAPSSLRDTDTGVFTGLMYSDYSDRIVGKHELEAHLGLGSASSVAAGRISYVLGLHGPSMAIDTACSSSLVTLHLAAKSLRAGECSLAIAGGVTVMATPRPFIMFSRQRGLSTDGLCRSYSADANGTSWSEGVGLLLLERLSDARRNGHRVLSILRGTAVNSDGTSNGLTAPSGPAQQQVIRQALASGGLSPADVDVVDGHGTATPLGDPIEVQALLATYGRSRQTPMLLGSVKSNLGHTQAAAGVAGVIKMICAMEHGTAPQTINATEPSRHVDWKSGAVQLLTKAQPWPRTDRPRRAAVSSFGIGGTNAHVILEQDGYQTENTPAVEPQRAIEAAYPWLLSGANEAALRAQARALLALKDKNPTDVSFSLATTRSALAYRCAVAPDNHAALMALADGQPHPDAVTGVAKSSKVAFLFSGQGTQRLHMGEDLCAAFPVFDEAFREACKELDPRLEHPLAQVIREEEDLLSRADFAQAAIFAFEVAMFRLMESFCIQPDYVAGHSAGEIAAAHVAGVLTLAHAAALVATRGTLMSTLPTGGAMASISATEEEVGKVLKEVNNTHTGTGTVVMAAVNAERSVVISGAETAVTAAMDAFTSQGRSVKRLLVSQAFHSPQMDPMLGMFREALKGLSFSKPSIPLVSTVTGEQADPDQICSPDYWVRQVSAPVRFADAVRTLSVNAGAFVEVGPSSALATHVPNAVAACGDVNRLLGALGRLHVQGIQVRWKAVFEGSGGRVTDLPVYQFQRRKYWLEASVQCAAESSLVHPVLTRAAPVPGTSQVLCFGRLSLLAQPWIKDHAMGGQALLPATAFAEIALRAGSEADCNSIEELAILAPLKFQSTEGYQIQVTLGEPKPDGNRSVDIYSRLEKADTKQEWLKHATGTLTNESSPTSADHGSWPSGQPVNITDAYTTLAEAGIGYGPAFQCVRSVWRDEDGLRAQIQLSEGQAPGGFMLHPALLDAALHVPLVAAPGSADIRLPFLLSGMRVFSYSGGPLRVYTRELREGRLSLTITDRTGALVAEVGSVTTRAWQPGAGELYQLEWIATDAATSTAFAREDDIILRIETDDCAPSRIGAVHSATADALAKIHHWSTEQAHTGQRLVVVTEKATVDDPDMVAAAVWGLVRSAQAEFPERIVLVDLDGTPESTAALPRTLASDKCLMALRNGTAMGPRLGQVPLGTSPEPLDTSGTVLITGGTGALGALLSRHLAQAYGARYLLLVSRSGLSAPGAVKLHEELVTYGADARIEACDTADRAQLAKLLAEANPPVSAVVHSAGIVDDAVLDALSSERISRVLRPKVDAAWNLHELLLNVRSFILFSSAAGMLGNRGQAAYAAGNCFLDALARHRASRGLPAISLAWGPWDNETGMAATVTRGGPLQAITDQQGLDLFDAALRASVPVMAPLALRAPVTFGAVRKTAAKASAQSESGTWREQLAALPTSERRSKLQELVRDEVGAVLGYDEVPDRQFTDLGIDSFMGVLLRNRLSVLTGLRLPGTLAFDYASVVELADFLLEELATTAEDTEATPAATEAPQALEPVSSQGPGPVLRLASLYLRVCQAGHYIEAAHLLATASLALPTFTAASSRAHAPTPQRLASGPGHAALVCFPDFFPKIAGMSIYSGLAAHLDGAHDVFELAYPVSPAPADFAALAAMHAATIRARFASRPVMLVGYSAGGCTAAAVAALLADRAAGLVLVDTYPPEGRDPDWLYALPAAVTLRAGAAFERVVSDDAVAAMGACLRITADWAPAPVAAPTLFLGARDRAPQIPEGVEWRARWPLAHAAALVPGDHLSLLDGDAATTAAAVRAWVGSEPPWAVDEPSAVAEVAPVDVEVRA